MHPNKKLLALLTLIIIVIVAVIGSYLVYQKSGDTVTPPDQVMCTMEAKQCPDGSYVSRHGPKCEFAQCPAAPSLSTFYTEIIAVFEGVWKLPFGFKYDDAKISVGTSTSRNEFIIKDLTSTDTASVIFSYEGGRGLTVNDYWAEVGSKKCPSCKPNTTSLTFAETTGIKAYSSATDQYLVIGISHSDAWVVLVRYPINNTNLETVVKTFAFPNTVTNPSPIPDAPESLISPSKESSTPKPY